VEGRGGAAAAAEAELAEKRGVVSLHAFLGYSIRRLCCYRRRRRN